MLLTLNKYGDTYEISDLDEPTEIPIAYFKERWRAVQFMKRQEGNK